jgi:chaperone modulatory protein CbpM
MKRDEPPIEAELLDALESVGLRELCQACDIEADYVIELVEVGVIEPHAGRRPNEWRFPPYSLIRLQRAVRLHRDLSVGPAGAALALDLIEEVAELRRRLHRLEDDRSV